MYGYITQVDFTSFFLETGKNTNCELQWKFQSNINIGYFKRKTNIESGLSISCIMTNVMIIRHTGSMHYKFR